MVWLKMIWFLILSDAYATILTLKAHYPILGNSDIKVVTIYDSENFSGFITQGIKITYTNGINFDILFQRRTFTVQEAFAQHGVVGECMILDYIQNRTLEPPSPVSNSSEEFEFFNVMQAIPEEEEENP